MHLRLALGSILVVCFLAPSAAQRSPNPSGTWSPCRGDSPPAGSLPEVTTVPATIDRAAWIGATWIGTTGTVTTEERWTPAASGAMLAVSRTLRGPQMSAFEFLCIVEREGTLAYVAMPNGRSPATYFMLTNITPDSATFENPAHDYPRLIRYSRLPDGSLQTTISAGGEVRARSVTLKKQ